MIHIARTNIFTSPARALVNPVNTVGVMGRGLAAEFKQRYPGHYAAYARACRNGALVPGRVFCHEERGKLIVCLPTKRHWRERSRLSYIKGGVAALAAELTRREMDSVAVPALGCGLGQLSWKSVRPVIEAGLSDLAEGVEVYLHPPGIERFEKPVEERRPEGAYDRQLRNMRRGWANF